MDRPELEAQAERALRRGELRDALQLYAQLARAAPDDPRWTARLEQLRETLQPAELATPSPAASHPGAARAPALPLTPEQAGERLFSLGDYGGAAAAYRRALELRPHSDLVRERLEEIYRLAIEAPPSSPTDAPLPAERGALLDALLSRISSRRRVRP